MRQVLRPGALGRPRGMVWGGRRERGSGWRIHVNPWLTHVNVWQKPLQYCKVISLQLIKINEKKKKRRRRAWRGYTNSCSINPMLKIYSGFIDWWKLLAAKTSHDSEHEKVSKYASAVNCLNLADICVSWFPKSIAHFWQLNLAFIWEVFLHNWIKSEIWPSQEASPC